MIRSLLLVLLVWGTSAEAQQPHPRCAAWAEQISWLADQFDEEPRVIALNGRGIIIEFWSNEQTGSWTMLHTTPDGQACIADSGPDFDIREATPNGDPT